MKIFISGSSLEKESIVDLQDKILNIQENIDNDITIEIFDWTNLDKDTSINECNKSIILSNAIMETDIFILLFNRPNYEYKGSYFELGVASMISATNTKIPLIIIINEIEEKHLFLNSPDIFLTFTDRDEFLEYFKKNIINNKIFLSEEITDENIADIIKVNCYRSLYN